MKSNRFFPCAMNKFSILSFSLSKRFYSLRLLICLFSLLNHFSNCTLKMQSQFSIQKGLTNLSKSMRLYRILRLRYVYSLDLFLLEIGWNVCVCSVYVLPCSKINTSMDWTAPHSQLDYLFLHKNSVIIIIDLINVGCRTMNDFQTYPPINDDRSTECTISAKYIYRYVSIPFLRYG